MGTCDEEAECRRLARRWKDNIEIYLISIFENDVISWPKTWIITRRTPWIFYPRKFWNHLPMLLMYLVGIPVGGNHLSQSLYRHRKKKVWFYTTPCKSAHK